MFPALRESLAQSPLPKEVVDAKSFFEIVDAAPILVRKSIQSVWSDSSDLQTRATEVFPEEDGVHSFFEVTGADALAAVAAFMTRMQRKRAAAYFFALSEELTKAHQLKVIHAPIDNSDCKALDKLHRHVEIDPSKRDALFSAIRDRKLYNFRVDKTSSGTMAISLASQGCHDYSPGPCSCQKVTVGA